MTGMLLLALSIVVVAWFTAAATAVRTVSRIWLRHWVERQLTGAGTASLYLERPQRLLLSATTTVSLTVFVAGVFLANTVRSAPLAVPPSTIAYALVLLVAGQLVPRAVGRRWATTLIPVLLPPLHFAELALTPLLRTARRLSGERDMDHARRPATDDEALEELLREGEMEGVSERGETAIISGVVQFGEKRIREVMTPRAEVFALDAALSPADLASQVASSEYSRVPVYRGSLDEVVGMVHVFDILKHADAPAPRFRPITTTSPEASCKELLSRMLRERKHLAVVRETAGAVAGIVAGIVTLEDLLEELVGDIRDEHDEPVTPAATDAPRGRDAAAGAASS